MAKPRRKNKDESGLKRQAKSASVPKGTARRTLSKARFFLQQAHLSERRGDSEAFECYVEAATIFARSVLGHLRNEFSSLKKENYDKFKKQLGLHEENPLIKELIKKRDAFVHGGSKRSIVALPSDQTDVFYGPLKEDSEKLPDQLQEISAIIDEFERQFS